MFVKLKPWDERKSKDEQIEAVVNAIRGATGDIKEARVLPIQPPAIPGLAMHARDALEPGDGELPAPARKTIIDPDSAPLPTARASMFGIGSAKAKKTAKGPVVQVAVEQPLAARFGRMDDSAADGATSLGFAQ